MFYNGDDTGSIGSRVLKWTVRQGRSRQGWGFPAEDTTQVNAKANTFEYFTVDFDISAMNDEQFEMVA